MSISTAHNMNTRQVHFQHHTVQVHYPSHKPKEKQVALGQLSIKEIRMDIGPILEFVERETSPTEAENLGWEELQNNEATTSNGTNTDPKSTPVQKQLHNFSAELSEISSYKLSDNGYPKVTIQLSSGSTLPTFHFPEKDHLPFLRALEEFYHFKKSTLEEDLYLVQYSKKDALERSFSELNLFDIPSNFVHNFMKDPYNATLGGFSKVTNFLFDRSFTLENDFENHKHIGISSVPPPPPSLNIGQHDESGFEIITCVQLPPRKPSTRGNLVTENIWNHHRLPNGEIKDFDLLKKQIFKGGIEPSLRKEVWKFLLGYYNPNSTLKEREIKRKEDEDYYFKMKLQWKSISDDQQLRFADFKERKNLVDKDVGRTDRTHPYYEGENNSNVETLRDILMTYVMYNFDLGYVQGMSDILSPLLVIMDDEMEAFWCFVKVMERVGQNFEMSQQAIKLQLQQLLTLIITVEPELADYLEIHGSSNLYFCFRWILIQFKREFNMSEISGLWEVLWTDVPCKNFHLLVCVAILSMEMNNIMENGFGLNEILKHINDMAFNIELDKVLCEAESIYHQLEGTDDLSSSVLDILGIPTREVKKSLSSIENEIENDLERTM